MITYEMGYAYPTSLYSKLMARPKGCLYVAEGEKNKKQIFVIKKWWVFENKEEQTSFYESIK